MNLPVRKHTRLKDFDYSQCGCYHITICAKNHLPVFSRVVPADSPTAHAAVQLSSIGKIVDQYIRNIPDVYSGVHLVKYVIMPNHVHLLVLFDPQVTTSVPTIVRSLKRLVNRDVGQSVWQDSYFDVIIRSDSMFQCEWSYIDSNPDKWAEDDLFVRNA